MKRNRQYPSWLPPNPQERTALLKLRRRQRIVIGWWAAMLPAEWLLALVARSGEDFVVMTIGWIAAGVFLSRRLTESRCPRCGESFCDQSQMPYVYGLFNSRCENCGLALAPDRNGDA